MDLRGTVASLDGVRDCRTTRNAIFNRDMVPDINPNLGGKKQPKRSHTPIFGPASFEAARRDDRAGVCLGDQALTATAAP
jgi:hypothetical protein